MQNTKRKYRKGFLWTASLLPLTFLITSCFPGRTVGALFEHYAGKKGFELEQTNPDMHFDFGNDKEIIAFANSVSTFYTLTYDSDEGDPEVLQRFQKQLNRLLEARNYKTAVEFKAGGRIALLVQRDKESHISALVLIKEFGSSYSWVWIPADKTKEEE